MKDKRKVLIELEQYEGLGDILGEIGVDLENAISMFLKKIVRDKNISFLFNEDKVLESANMEKVKYFSKENTLNVREMSKKKAELLFNEKKLLTNKPYFYTYATKNRSADVFWANPNFRCLELNWYLILNDYINKRLHLFYIPPKSISSNRLAQKSESSPNLIDLRIIYDDPTFTDESSQISFRSFYIESIDY